MNLYFSGLGGVAIGPLALICRDAGHHIAGSDMVETRWTRLMEAEGVPVAIGQDGSQIAAAHAANPIDWLVISAAVPPTHPEVQFAKAHGIKVSKRAEMLNLILQQQRLKLVAISGTHGKTTTTAMVVWLFKQFDKPVSYSVGSHMRFAPSGAYEEGSEYFVYECDEYDRNMLQFRPFLSLIPSVDYDHADIYPTRQDYDKAFLQFAAQSQAVIAWDSDVTRLRLTHPQLTVIHEDEPRLGQIHLPGLHYRQNAWQAATAFCRLFPEIQLTDALAAVSRFPGTDRRFERLAEGIYTFYSHHPAEIRADLQQLRELSDRVVVAYQPHQNSRQHEFIDEYHDCFDAAEHVYWLPTYLSREDPALETLTPAQLISHLTNPAIAEPAELDEALASHLRQARASGALVVLMGAGSIDEWARREFA